VHAVTYIPVSGAAHYEDEKFCAKREETRFDFVSVALNVTIMSLVELPDGRFSAAEPEQA
jgi:hypothetical protein